MSGHSRVSGNPPEVIEGVGLVWIPAGAGMIVDTLVFETQIGLPVLQRLAVLIEKPIDGTPYIELTLK